MRRTVLYLVVFGPGNISFYRSNQFHLDAFQMWLFANVYVTVALLLTNIMIIYTTDRQSKENVQKFEISCKHKSYLVQWQKTQYCRQIQESFRHARRNAQHLTLFDTYNSWYVLIFDLLLSVCNKHIFRVLDIYFLCCVFNDRQSFLGNCLNWR